MKKLVYLDGHKAVLYRSRMNPSLGRNFEALDTLKKAWDAGFKDAEWARRDPDLAILHGEAEFEKLCPAQAAGE